MYDPPGGLSQAYYSAASSSVTISSKSYEAYTGLCVMILVLIRTLLTCLSRYGSLTTGIDGESIQLICAGLGAITCQTGTTIAVEATVSAETSVGATVITPSANSDHELSTTVTFSVDTSDAMDMLGGDIVVIPILRCVQLVPYVFRSFHLFFDDA